MQCCKLANPSLDIGTKYNQLATLYQTVGELAVVKPDHTCSVTMSMGIDNVASAITMLPKTFCFNVQVPELCTPAPCPPPGTGALLDKPILSPLAFGIINQYGIDQSTIVAVIDSVCDGAQLLKLANAPKLVVFLTGKGQILNNAPPVLGLTIVDWLPSDLLFNVLVHCNRHLIIGSLLGWWGAALSGSEYVQYSDPWSLGVHLTEVYVNPKWKSVNWNWTNTPYFDRAYYINLDRRPDRRAHMEAQLAKYHINATRISAVDGKTIQWRPDYGYLSNFWNNGALAYCLSYREIIADAINNKYDYILVMDDDAVLTDQPGASWLQTLASAWSELPEEWHMLYLAANHGYPVATKTPTQRIGDHLYRLTGSMGSHAIILNSKCFNYLLQYMAAPYLPLDTYFSLYQQFFPCYITYPGLASQLPGQSDIINRDIDYTKDWGIDYINWLAPTQAQAQAQAQAPVN